MTPAPQTRSPSQTPAQPSRWPFSGSRLLRYWMPELFPVTRAFMVRMESFTSPPFHMSVLPQLNLEFCVDRVILRAEGGSRNDPIPKNFHRPGKSRDRPAAPCRQVTRFRSLRRIRSTANTDLCLAEATGRKCRVGFPVALGKSTAELRPHDLRMREEARRKTIFFLRTLALLSS